MLRSVNNPYDIWLDDVSIQARTTVMGMMFSLPANTKGEFYLQDDMVDLITKSCVADTATILRSKADGYDCASYLKYVN